MFWFASGRNIGFPLFPRAFSAEFTVPDFATSIITRMLLANYHSRSSVRFEQLKRRGDSLQFLNSPAVSEGLCCMNRETMQHDSWVAHYRRSIVRILSNPSWTRKR